MDNSSAFTFVQAIRDPKYYFEDGNIVLSVGGYLFKIHRSLLISQSSVFEDMFQLPKQEKTTNSTCIDLEGTVDKNPITIPQVLAGQFRNLLLFFYGNMTDPEYQSLVLDAMDESKHNLQAFKRYLDIASLAHRFCMESVETWALVQFKKVTQSSKQLLSSSSAHTDLLSALTYSKLTSDRELEYDIRNIAQCCTKRPKPEQSPPTSSYTISNGMVSLYKDSNLKEQDPALFGHIFCVILGEGHKSSYWAALTRDDRAKLFAAQAYLTPLPSTLPISWIHNIGEISTGVDAAQRPSCFSGCSQTFLNQVTEIFEHRELRKALPLTGINVLSRLPFRRQQLAENLKQAKCTCIRQLLTVVDVKLNALFTDLAVKYHDRLD